MSKSKVLYSIGQLKVGTTYLYNVRTIPGGLPVSARKEIDEVAEESIKEEAVKDDKEQNRTDQQPDSDTARDEADKAAIVDNELVSAYMEILLF